MTFGHRLEDLLEYSSNTTSSAQPESSTARTASPAPTATPKPSTSTSASTVGSPPNSASATSNNDNDNDDEILETIFSQAVRNAILEQRREQIEKEREEAARQLLIRAAHEVERERQAKIAIQQAILQRQREQELERQRQQQLARQRQQQEEAVDALAGLLFFNAMMNK